MNSPEVEELVHLAFMAGFHYGATVAIVVPKRKRDFKYLEDQIRTMNYSHAVEKAVVEALIAKCQR